MRGLHAMPSNDLSSVYDLAIALALGLVIGVEREWRERDLKGGRRPAGLRTFGLIGLTGGVAGLIGGRFPFFPGIGLGLTVLVMVAAYWRRSRNGDLMGVTTIFAATLAYACGVLVIMDLEIAATAAAVTVAMILGSKDRLHRFVRRLEQKEIFAVLQFILIAGVILPLIPNNAMGPYNAINPFEIWLMAVLISGLSFLGYIALQALKARQGILGTALLGGLVSSTATTVSLARMARRQPGLSSILSVGVIAASSIMFVRVWIIVGAISWPLLARLLVPVGVIIALLATSAFYLARQYDDYEFEKPEVSNPLDIVTALSFALLLGVIMVGSRALEAMFGAEGIYAISIASGLADVDAITLSLSRFSTDNLATDVAAVGIMIAAITNTLVKIALVAFAGGEALRPAFATLAAGVVAGGVATYLVF
jgi:uncharacterized membrane protein (DUF4010 family)